MQANLTWVETDRIHFLLLPSALETLALVNVILFRCHSRTGGNGRLIFLKTKVLSFDTKQFRTIEDKVTAFLPRSHAAFLSIAFLLFYSTFKCRGDPKPKDSFSLTLPFSLWIYPSSSFHIFDCQTRGWPPTTVTPCHTRMSQ